MKREDFKEILPVHIESCKSILEQKVGCLGIDCCQCPFHSENSEKYDCEEGSKDVISGQARHFLNLFEKNFQPEQTEVPDNVNQPNHYKLDGLDVEVLDIIKAVLTKEQFEGFLHGNVIKYTLRTNKKNGVEDLEKAHKYLGWLIDSKSGLKLNK